MKRIYSAFLVAFLLLALCACGQKTEEAPTWQEQYDLGIRYLSEGNYEEAIIAFTAAIEIDPKNADAYIALAEVYTAQGDTDAARDILNQALGAVGENEDISAALEALTPAELQPLGPGKSFITVQEGKYHQVRRMMASRGMTVRYLRRDTEGGLTLAGMEKGCVRELTDEEIHALDA